MTNVLPEKEKQPRKGGKIRLIVGIALVVLVVVFALTVTVQMRQRIEAADEAAKPLLRRALLDNWVAFTGMLIVSLAVVFGIMPFKKNLALKIICCVIFGIGVLVTAESLILSGRMLIGVFQKDASPDAQYVVVLGSELNEDKSPTADLTSRVNTAWKWWNSHPETTLILSNSAEGGEAASSSSTTVTSKVSTSLPGRTSKKKGNTPSAVMSNILQKDKGVPAEQIIVEDQSRNEEQGFENILAMENIDESTAIVVVTTNYDMVRAVEAAEKAGFTNISRLPAPASFWEFGTNLLWETWNEYDPVLKAAAEEV